MDNNTNNWKEFTLGNPQEEQPRRVAKRSKRKPLLVLLIVAVLGKLIKSASALKTAIPAIGTLLSSVASGPVGIAIASIAALTAGL